MVISSIKDKEIFRIEEEITNQIFYGSNQEWYTKRWQRMAGCGPSTVTNIIYYLNRTRNSEQYTSNLTKSEYLDLMNEIWRFVTPSIGGISSTDMLCKGAQKYLTDRKLKIKLDTLDIPKKYDLRPEFKQVISFIDMALSNDSPVAFLNLDNGTVEELDSWHWVTIIGLEYSLDDEAAVVDFLDEAMVKKIDFSQWLKTTKMGGGFVSFEL
ncbi:MAG TPA: hypothetical protein VN131_02620 [Mobilitalea sp.]|nr:hypothetical protein [Mobilitalea sp.]